MTVQCISCQNFNLQAAGKEFAAMGFGQCDIARGATHKSARYSSECVTHSPAPADITAKRVEWLESRRAAA